MLVFLWIFAIIGLMAVGGVGCIVGLVIFQERKEKRKKDAEGRTKREI